MRLSGVYKIVNNENGNIYVGSAINLKKREIQHFWELKNNSHCNNYLQKSFNKYGANKFTFEIISHCVPEVCVSKEQYFIDFYKKNGFNLYNICEVAGSVFGIKRTEETKMKLSIAAKNRPPISLSARQRLSEVHKGIKPSIETINKRKESNKGFKHTDATKNKLSISLKGRKRTPEQIERIRLSQLGKKHTEEHKLKISQSQIGKKISDKSKKLMSDACKLKKKVYQYDINGNYIASYNSITDASRGTGVSLAGISNCANGLTDFCKNYKFKFNVG